MTDKCTHTSDWWKEMMICACCGAEYSDEEAERIAGHAEWTFSSQQLCDIERWKAEDEGKD